MSRSFSTMLPAKLCRGVVLACYSHLAPIYL